MWSIRTGSRSLRARSTRTRSLRRARPPTRTRFRAAASSTWTRTRAASSTARAARTSCGADRRRAPGLTTEPKLVAFGAAAFAPNEARSSVGTLAITIGLDGAVRDVSVLASGGADFDAAAVEAARHFVFEPAEVDGSPAAVKIA